MKNQIRVVMTIYLMCSVVAIYFCIMSLINTTSDAITIQPIIAEPLVLDSRLSGAQEEYYTFESLAATPKSSEPDYIDSIRMKTDYGWVDTNPVILNSDKLMEIYYRSYITLPWDSKEKIALISTLWEFLVNQQGMDEMQASAVIGALMDEGNIGEEEGTYIKFSSIHDVRAKLGSSDIGYGIVQWTYKTRQKALLEYYELAYALYPEDWDRVCIIAECCMLLRELEAYDMLSDDLSHTTLEDTVGRLCVRYERYSGCEEQWSNRSGQYRLLSNNCSGSLRFEYAKNIYKYFGGAQ